MSKSAIGLTSVPVAQVQLKRPRISDSLRGVWNELRRDAAALAGVIILAVLFVIALIGPWITPYPPNAIDLIHRLQPPFWVPGGDAAHPFGTDALGRDILSRLIVGARISLSTGLAVVAIAGSIGITLGLIAGYVGGKWETVILRVVDATLAFPGLLLAIVVLSMVGPSQLTVILVLSALGWMVYTRVTHDVVLDMRERTFIKAAEMVGASPREIITKHLVPNIASPLLTVATLEFARIILAEASLSYLGLGIQPPAASWGLMVAESQEYLTSAWWPIAIPGFAIALTVLAINFVASWLRVISDPMQRDRKVLRLLGGSQRGGSAQANAQNATVTANTPLLQVQDLQVNFYTSRGIVYAVQGASFEIARGETVGIVGESGSGKSISAMALMGLVPPPGRIEGGTLSWMGRDITAPDKIAGLRGRNITMVFQDPVGSLNPLLTIGSQLTEVLIKQKGMTAKQAQARAIELLSLVGIPSPQHRMSQYPFEFSGGMAQRMGIALALAPEPDLIIADEPTTALDVTIQAQILELISELQSKFKMAMILIAHDLGVVASSCDRVIVMYGGRIMEEGTPQELFAHPKHPYTYGLLQSIPDLNRPVESLVPIPGSPPLATTVVQGCNFAPRCFRATEKCRAERPPLVTEEGGRKVACWHEL
jgi:peptide/nickel transport system permease protein